MLFDKPCTKTEYNKIHNINMSWFRLVRWIWEADMTDEQKENNQTYKTTGGFLHKQTHKEAWAECPKNVIEQIKKLKNNQI